MKKPVLNASKLALHPGDSYQIKLYGNTQPVKWYSSDDWVAEVDANGNVYTDGFEGDVITITAQVASGHTYVCEVTVYERHFTVTFDTNGGSSIEKQKLDFGEFPSEPADPMKDGYSFGGWYTDSDCTNTYDFDVAIKNDFTLYAKWVSSNDSRTLSHEEWIKMLVETIDLSVTENEYHKFDDFSDSESPNLIDSALNAGIIPTYTDEDNMVFIYPSAVTTREYAAYTAVKALRIQASYDLPECSDIRQLTHKNEDLIAIKMNMLNTISGEFKPEKSLTNEEAQHILSIVEQYINSAEHIQEKSEIQYREDVEEINVKYDVNEEDKVINVTSNVFEVLSWKKGEIYVLHDTMDESDIAIKVVGVKKEGSYAVVEYETPELSEVVTSFDVEGRTSSQGEFTPAEGITILNDNGLNTQAAASGVIPLFGDISISLNKKISNNSTLSGKVNINIKELEYRLSANPSWHLFSINEVYFTLNSTVGFTNIEYSKEAQSGKLPIKLGKEKIKIGDTNIPIGGGFNVSGELSLIASAQGIFKIGFEINNKSGIQYTKNSGIRTIDESDMSNLQVALSLSKNPSQALSETGVSCVNW